VSHRDLCRMEFPAPCRLECWPKPVLCMLYPQSVPHLSEAVDQQNRSYCCPISPRAARVARLSGSGSSRHNGGHLLVCVVAARLRLKHSHSNGEYVGAGGRTGVPELKSRDFGENEPGQNRTLNLEHRTDATQIAQANSFEHLGNLAGKPADKSLSCV
jgi:hypothetical protein